MSVLTARPMMRWLVPVAAAAAVIGGGAAIGVLTAAADQSLPPRSPQQLLVDLQTMKVDGLSGTIVERADLGLPPLPSMTPDGSADLGSIVSGTHTLRVWYAAPTKARVALVGTLGETDVISNGTDLWVWSSQENTARHQKIGTTDITKPGTGLPKGLPSGLPTALPSGVPSGLAALLGGGAGGVGPDQLATLALSALGTTTSITSSGTTTVAGRDAYELILAPKDGVSRIGSVRLAIDATEHMPLRLQVFAHGADTPAIEIAFTQISFATPDATEFTFNPPPGARTIEGDTPTPGGTATPSPSPATPAAPAAPAAKKIAVVGSGWSSVVVARVPKPSAGTPASAASGTDPQAELAKVLATLPTVSGTWGSGKLLSGALFSALITDDGRLLIGAVGPDRLYQAAADPAARLPA
jgi:outer membrane lipoprotein-sorting protein